MKFKLLAMAIAFYLCLIFGFVEPLPVTGQETRPVQKETKIENSDDSDYLAGRRYRRHRTYRRHKTYRYKRVRRHHYHHNHPGCFISTAKDKQYED